MELSARETDKLRGVDEMSILRARVFLTAMRLYIQYKWDMVVLIILMTVAFLEAVRVVGE